LPRKTKKIAIVHNLNPHEKRFFDRWFNRIFLGAYDGFVVLSASVQQEVLRLKPAAKIALIPHPPYETECAPISKEEARAQLGLDPHKKTLLFFGLIRPYKGLSELIAAFGLLDGNYQLLIAGEVYGSSATYESALTALPFENWKFDNRYIADSEVASYFAAADLVVLPYLSATQSGVRAMALSQQRAVLCTNVGGLAEGLEANQHGFELKSTRPEQFAERIQQLFNQGDITECNRQLSRLNLDLEQAWLSFAKGLIALAEDA
jgi:glycosyltransferase involved in cell wall biosynthesis